MSRGNDYAQRKGKTQPNPAGKRSAVGDGLSAEFVGFVSFSPTDAQKAEFSRLWEANLLWDDVTTVVTDGMKLSVSWSAKEECFTAFLMERREQSPNAGMMVGARADTPFKAMLRAAYYVRSCLPEVWVRPGGEKGKDLW
jgi:hypothetical protein